MPEGDRPANSTLDRVASRRVAVKTSWLTTGNLIAAGLGILATIVLLRTLGTRLFGCLAMMQAFGTVVGEFCTLQTWQASTRNGSNALAENRPARLVAYLQFATRLDFAVTTLSVCGACWLALAAGSLWAWPAEWTLLAGLFCLTAYAKLSNTPVSIFNLAGHMHVHGLHAAAMSALRLVALLAVAAWQPTLLALGLTCVVMSVLSTLVQFVLARRSLHKLLARFDQSCPKPRLLLRNRPARITRAARWEFVRSTMHTSVFGSLQVTTTHLTTLLMGGLLGPIAAAQMRVLQTIGQAMMRLGMPLVHALYPEFATASRTGDFTSLHVMWRRVCRLLAILTAIGYAIYLPIGATLLRLLFGPEFVPLFWPLALFLPSCVLAIVTSTTVARLWAMQSYMPVLVAQLLGTAASLLALLATASWLGIYSAVLAAACYQCCLQVVGTASVRRRERILARSVSAPERLAA